MKGQLLGEFFFSKESFKDIDTIFKDYQTAAFQKLSEQEKCVCVNRSLCTLIEEESQDFLLPALLHYIDRVNQEKVLREYLFSHFELWLNQFSGLSFEENLHVRGKIVGRQIPRVDYQGLFPVAMGKVYPGDHIVTAHGSPDLDTTIASFWGWVDAFGARVSEGLHLWNVPGGVPESQVEIDLLFKSPFGDNVFSYLARTQTTLSSCAGTVSLRDFSNREETKIPPSLEIISVIDHHKCSLANVTPSVITIADVQSCNVLVAEKSFEINDKHSLGGMTLVLIEKQLAKIQQDLKSSSSLRILGRLLQRYSVAKGSSSSRVSPKREYLEYLHLLYAILDDTDLLSKVSPRDITCVVSILNRLKSLSVKEEVEIIVVEDAPHVAIVQILQNEDMYSLYSKVYAAKEASVEDNLVLCSKGEPSTLFNDTKEQNGCCRVGQTKMFAKNWPVYQKKSAAIRSKWLQEAEGINQGKAEVDLHVHMLSTIIGAEEIYEGNTGSYPHQDELWIWISGTEPSIEHLKCFLTALKSSPQVRGNTFTLEVGGENAPLLEQIFAANFLSFAVRKEAHNLSLAILYFTAGTMNSRKAMISPYLPSI